MFRLDEIRCDVYHSLEKFLEVVSTIVLDDDFFIDFFFFFFSPVAIIFRVVILRGNAEGKN